MTQNNFTWTAMSKKTKAGNGSVNKTNLQNKICQKGVKKGEIQVLHSKTSLTWKIFSDNDGVQCFHGKSGWATPRRTHSFIQDQERKSSKGVEMFSPPPCPKRCDIKKVPHHPLLFFLTFAFKYHQDKNMFHNQNF